MTPHSDILWETVPYSWAEAERLARELSIPFPVAVVLAGRGLSDPQAARTFLDCSAVIPDPYLFADMTEAVDRLETAIERRERIVVHGDYDADGITATALMVLGLRPFGVEAGWFLPSRFTEGFGLSRTAVERIAAEGPGLLVTVDCGVNYPDEVRLAQQMGLDVIVIDHHQPGPELPGCLLIHPVRGDYPSEDLCGVGLAFKVLHALHVRREGAAVDQIPEALHGLLDLVAVGTIADLAPLRGENRYYAKEGLKLLTIGSRVGPRALSKVAGCAGAVDCGAVSFRLAPRLNAAGRLADASPPLRLLLTEDEATALEIAGALHELNGQRQEVERGILEEAVAQVEALAELPRIVVLSGQGWHEGVVGIVASRLVERYHRPVLLLGEREGIAKGSGRSIAPYDLMAGLTACSEWLTVFGGHTQAVGLTLEAARLEGFKRAIEEHAAARLSAEDVRSAYRADAVLRGEDINADTALALASLGPFGRGNPRPRLLLVDAALRQVEVTRTGGHLRCVVDVDGVKTRAIGFGMGHRAAELQDEREKRVIGAQLLVDEWQGALRPELRLDRIGDGTQGGERRIVCGAGCTRGEGGGVDAAPGPVGSAPVCAATTSLPTAVLPATGAACDLRGSRGRMAALAQVLASGETTVIFTCSVSHALVELTGPLPLESLTRGRMRCLTRACSCPAQVTYVDGGVSLVEWDASAGASLGRPRHVVVLDPPYRAEHTQLLRALAKEGAGVHLYYGEEQRRSTARLLRYLVHPRFAMVCLYRALSGGSRQADARSHAAELAWREGGVVLSEEALDRADRVLAGLDLGQNGEGEAKIDLQSIPAYAEAEADYEECSRLCRIL